MSVVLLLALTTSIASAAPQRDSGSGGFVGAFTRIIKRILGEPSVPIPTKASEQPAVPIPNGKS